MKGKESHKDTIERMEIDRSMAWDPKFQMQWGKVCDRAKWGRNEPRMVRPLRSYNPYD